MLVISRAAIAASLLIASEVVAQPTPAPPSDPARLALVDLPDNVVEAVHITLAAWSVEILRVTAESLGPTMPETATAARVLAERHQVAAVVWISSSESGPALWVLDGATDKVVARPLSSEPPFDEATATAIGLTIKTLLRHSLVAPEPERFGATEKTAPRVEVPPPEPPPRVGVEALSGVRLRPSGIDGVEPRLGLAVFWAPAALDRRLDLGLGVRVGLGTSVISPELAATFFDNTLAAQVRFRALLAPISLAPYLAASAHFTRLDGALAIDSSTISVSRINPSIDLGARAAYRLGPIDLGLWGEASPTLRRQRYEVGGVPVLELPRVELEVGVSVTLPSDR